MEDLDFNIFPSKKGSSNKTSFSDIMREIYERSNKTDTQISRLIVELSSLINNANDAAIIIPNISELLRTGVSNNDQLIKLAAVAQRAKSAIMKHQPSTTVNNVAFILDDNMRDELAKEVDSAKSELQEIASIPIPVDKQKVLNKLNTYREKNPDIDGPIEAEEV